MNFDNQFTAANRNALSELITRRYTAVGLSARVLYDFTANQADDITIRQNDLITNIETRTSGWWYGTGQGFMTGYFPSNYVQPFKDAIILPLRRSLKAVNAGLITGIAHLCGRLFVTFNASTVIKVYSTREPLDVLKSIKVNGGQKLYDIVACEETCKLFVVDMIGRCIWRISEPISSSPDKCTVSRWIETPFKPWSLSIRCTRLLVTTTDGNEIFLYDVNGRLVQYVRLPEYFDTWRAVETNSETFIVCHQGHCQRSEADNYHQISEVDSKGHVIRTYGSQRGDGVNQLSEPTYVDIITEDSLLICDSGHGRLLWIAWNSTLRTEKTILPTITPWKLCSSLQKFCFVKSAGLLIIISDKYINYYDFPFRTF